MIFVENIRMAYNIIIFPAAETDTIEAHLFYETQQAGLGERFLESVEESYYKLSQKPQYYSYISSEKHLRDIKIKDFPFVMIYQIIEDKVLVLRVFNTNRNPLSLKNL